MKIRDFSSILNSILNHMDIKHFCILVPDCGMPYLSNLGRSSLTSLKSKVKARLLNAFINCNYVYIWLIYIFSKALLDSEEAALYKSQFIIYY